MRVSYVRYLKAIIFVSLVFLFIHTGIRAQAANSVPGWSGKYWDENGNISTTMPNDGAVISIRNGSDNAPVYYDSVVINEASKTCTVKNVTGIVAYVSLDTVNDVEGWTYVFEGINTIAWLEIDSTCTIKMQNGSVIYADRITKASDNAYTHQVTLVNANSSIHSKTYTDSFVATYLKDATDYTTDKDYICAKDKIVLQPSDLKFPKTTYQKTSWDPIIPEYTVTYKGQTLVENQDYVVELTYNELVYINATIKITGIGKYFAQMEKTFYIYTNLDKKFVINGGLYRITDYCDVTYWRVQNKKKKITIPSTVVIDDVTYNVVRIDEDAFKKNKKLETVIIPGSIKFIDEDAFRGCKKLKNITIYADNLKSIDYSFYDISPDAKVTIVAKDKKTYKKVVKMFKKNTNVKTIKFKMKKSKR